MKLTNDTKFVLISTACIFLACGLVVFGYFAWNPIRTQWYIRKLRGNRRDRYAAMDKLEEIKNSRAAVWALAEALDGRYGEREAQIASTILRNRRRDSDELVLSVLTDILRNGDDDKLRSVCAERLPSICGYQAIPILIETLDDKSDKVRTGAMLGISFFLDCSVFNSGAAPVIGILAEAGAASEVELLKEESVGPKLIETLAGDECKLRALAALLLGYIDHKSSAPAVVRVLGQLLKDEDVVVRMASALALERTLRTCPDKSVLPALREAVNDPEYTVRLFSIDAMWNVGGKSEVPLLANTLFTDENPLVRNAAAVALGKIGDHSATPILLKVLENDKHEYARSGAAWALSEIDGRSAVPLLIKLLGSDEHERVRKTAACALGKIGDGSAIPTLINGLSDADRYVREACHGALQKITGEKFPFGDDAVEKWRVKLGAKEAVQEDETQAQD